MIKFIYALLQRRQRPIYTPSTESVRRYEQGNRNRASLANYRTTKNPTGENHYERQKHASGR